MGAVIQPMNAALPEVYFLNYQLAKICNDKGVAFSPTNIELLEQTSHAAIGSSNLANERRDEVWRSVKDRIDAMHPMIARQDCVNARIKVMCLFPGLFRGRWG